MIRCQFTLRFPPTRSCFDSSHLGLFVVHVLFAPSHLGLSFFMFSSPPHCILIVASPHNLGNAFSLRGFLLQPGLCRRILSSFPFFAFHLSHNGLLCTCMRTVSIRQFDYGGRKRGPCYSARLIARKIPYNKRVLQIPKCILYTPVFDHHLCDCASRGVNPCVMHLVIGKLWHLK